MSNHMTVSLDSFWCRPDLSLGWVPLSCAEFRWVALGSAEFNDCVAKRDVKRPLKRPKGIPKCPQRRPKPPEWSPKVTKSCQKVRLADIEFRVVFTVRNHYLEGPWEVQM